MFTFARIIYHCIARVLALPFVLMTKFTRYVYVAELISLIPFRIGEHIRFYFYKKTLTACGDDVIIRFGTIISYPDIKIGNHVYLGVYNTLGLVEIGDFTQTAQHCNLLSGAHHHEFNDANIPIMEQASNLDKIIVGSDVWIGANATIMANIGKGCVIGAGSIVTKEIPPYSVAAGNPAHIIKSRK